ncbi:MAG: TlpA disulfide reductase family protein [Bdellovibrionales bacterium]
MFKRLIASILSIALLVSFGLMFFCMGAAAQAQTLVPVETPVPLPSTLLHTGKGVETTLANVLQEKGKSHYYLIHLWAPSCRACVPEMKQLDKIQTSLSKQGFTLVSIAQDPNGSFTVPAFERRHEITTINSYIDEKASMIRTLRPAGLPTTYLATPDGLIIAFHEGAMDWEHMGALKTASSAPIPNVQ